MADVRDLIPTSKRDHEVHAGMWYGYVARPAPLTEESSLFVVVPDIDINTKFGPCFWTPHSKKQTFNLAEPAEAARNVDLAVIVLPVYKSKVLLIWDNKQNPWVVAWW